MEKLIQYATKASAYDGPFDSVVGWSAAGMGYIVKSENGKIIVIDGGHDEDGFTALRNNKKPFRRRNSDRGGVDNNASAR